MPNLFLDDNSSVSATSVVYRSSASALARISLIVSFGSLQMNSALRAVQSRFLIWSQRATPFTGSTGGKGRFERVAFDLVGYWAEECQAGFLIIGFGREPTAGRRPACSWPAWGLKCSQTTSPRFGTYRRDTYQASPPSGPSTDISRWILPLLISATRSGRWFIGLGLRHR